MSEWIDDIFNHNLKINNVNIPIVFVGAFMF